MTNPLVVGAYEHVVTAALERRLQQVDPDLVARNGLDPADSHEMLTRHIAALTRRALRRVGGGTDAEVVANQVELANRISAAIADLAPGATSTEELIAASNDLLFAIAAPPVPPAQPRFPKRPLVPLGSSALLINGRGQPSIGHEIGLELASADKVDLLCAFVKWNGLRTIEVPIREFLVRGGRLRVITTTYIGATERAALDRLVDWGAEVKVSFETQATRLHAKAWLFRRATGLDTAYVGSSNLSRMALVDGLEWNVRLSGAEQPHLIEQFAGTFEHYWSEPAFERYEPARDGDRLEQALRQERRGPSDLPVEIATLEVQARPHQQEVLDEIDAERVVHGRWRNLVVMATGTGKTVVAALDYKRLRHARTVETLLFVAHREEILRQSLSTFRHVLRDGSFGESLVGGDQPREWQHVFGSIQSLARVAEIDPVRFDMVIVDEFHHAEAATYTRLLEALRPKVLLGLTATPERSDGGDVTRWFGGRVATELRLWEALERQLLVPFHYFGIHDDVSLEAVRWRRGQGYDVTELTNLYTGREARVRLIIKALRDKVPDVSAMRAVGFCVSVDHARYMAQRFNAVGIPSIAVTAQSTPDERRAARRGLESGDVKALFTVDLFNEGVDIPAIDTVLFLRPTESATVFLQQLGRGLRRADGKAVLTVLDFVGAQHAEFRYDLRYRALTGVTRRRLEHEIEEGFPTLPSGCHIELDRVVSKLVLDNVRRSLAVNRHALVAELRRIGKSASLHEFLVEVGVDLEDIYRRSGWGGWTGLRRLAGFDRRSAGPNDGRLGKAIGRMLHIDDPDRLAHLRRILASGPAVAAPASEAEARLQEMLRLALFGATADAPPAHMQLSQLSQDPSRAAELAEVADVLFSRIRRVTHAVGAPAVPLQVHCRYSRDEALAAFGDHRAVAYMRQGVRWVESAKADLFFVTLNKTERHFSPTTRYADRAITADLFQWESQNTTTEASPTGLRYINHARLGSSVHLFVRESKERDGDLGAPAYFYAGPMSYVEHHGDRPMRIIWELHNPLPADVLPWATAAPA